MREIIFTSIMGITALAMLVMFVGPASAQQTGAISPVAKDMSVVNVTPGLESPASFQLVVGKGHGFRGGRHFGFGSGIYLGWGSPGAYYYGGYPYSYSTEPFQPTCVWNGYQYTCYNSSGQILEE